jgi:predicted amidohydrolase
LPGVWRAPKDALGTVCGGHFVALARRPHDARRVRNRSLQTRLPHVEGKLQKYSSKHRWQGRYFEVSPPARGAGTQAWRPTCCARVTGPRVSRSPLPQLHNGFLNYYADSSKKALLAAIDLSQVRRTGLPWPLRPHRRR